MSLFDYLENLQKAPEKKRQKARMLISGIVTGSIFILWLMILLPTGIKNSGKEGVAAAAANNQQLGNTFQSITDSMDTLKNSMQDAVNQAPTSDGTAIDASSTNDETAATDTQALDTENNVLNNRPTSDDLPYASMHQSSIATSTNSQPAPAASSNGL